MMERAEIRQTNDDQSIGDLFGRLASDAGTLIRSEIRLAVAETKQNVRSVGSASAWLATGILIGALSIMTMVAALILLISIWLPAWLSAAVVSFVLAGVGAAIAKQGWSMLNRAEFAPEDSIESIKEDAEWLKGQIKS